MHKSEAPKFVRVWFDACPKCCHTCVSYMDDGTCLSFDEPPPRDFARTLDKCPKWSALWEVPF